MQAFISGLEPAARVVVATLFNSLWEAALLAAIVALVLRVLPNVNATTRYAAWCVALVASLLLPLATALPQIAVQQPAPAVLRADRGDKTVPVRTTRRAAPATIREVQGDRAAATPAAPSFRLPERLHFALPQYVALAIFAVWSIAALLLLVRLAINLRKLEHLKSDALPLPVEYRERLQRWAKADKGEREVRLCICENIEVPVAVGLFDSMILIPKHLLDTLTQNEVDQIILHELAHLRRADDWTNGLQRFIQALFFFNPAVLYIAGQLDLEREVACDDWVVDQTKEVRPYATCLTKMAEATAWPHRPLAAPGVFITRRGLSVRVERLLRVGRNIRTSVSFGPTGAIVASLIVLFFVLQNVAPSFAFTLTQQQQQQQQQQAQASHTAVVYKVPSPSPSPEPKVRASDIYVPAVDVHVPARRIHVVMPSVPPVPKVRSSLPPDFAKKMAAVSQTVQQAVSSSMAAAFSGKDGGKYNCVGCDYSGQNLSGHSFRGQQLSGADFSRTNLRNADFSNSVLVGVDFSHADLTNANFSGAKLTGCDFSHANIEGINLTGVSMMGCDIDARSLPPNQAAALVRGCPTGCDFSYANLNGQNLANLRLTGVSLAHADLRNANLTNARFEGVDLSGARLDGARLNGAQLTGCDFTGVDLHNVDFSNARIEGSKMNGSNR
ncbi:MAG TPA: pentapeptide repeat-containing protein [Candidatus Baltobacteraceae bacterium]|nr:pentapeptide repeat-containing protein [Candidatus Baltobacteraceae bacterium]